MRGRPFPDYRTQYSAVAPQISYGQAYYLGHNTIY